MSKAAKSKSLVALEALASDLVSEWAQSNKDTVWLGAKSRRDMQADVLRQLKKAYLLAKEKYSDGRGNADN